MTRQPWEGYAPYACPSAVNLTTFTPPVIYDSGYYLLSAPHGGVKHERVGVDLATRERARLLYRVKRDLITSGRKPTPWRMALGEVLELERTAT